MTTPTPTPERTRPAWLLPALVVGGLLAAGVLALTQPWLLFIDEVANETLPEIAPVTQTDEADATDQDMDEDMEDGTSAEEDTATSSSMDEQDAAMAEAIEQNAPPAPTGPVVLASGAFISRDHGTSGDVAIVQLEDGSRVLTIEGLQTDNGPDLFVYLDDTAADGPEGDFDDGISLGRLRANIGDLVYEIPDEVDLERIVSVGIWCDRFSSLFGAADLLPA